MARTLLSTGHLPRPDRLHRFLAEPSESLQRGIAGTTPLAFRPLPYRFCFLSLILTSLENDSKRPDGSSPQAFFNFSASVPSWVVPYAGLSSRGANLPAPPLCNARGVSGHPDVRKITVRAARRTESP